MFKGVKNTTKNLKNNLDKYLVRSFLNPKNIIMFKKIIFFSLVSYGYYFNNNKKKSPYWSNSR